MRYNGEMLLDEVLTPFDRLPNELLFHILMLIDCAKSLAAWSATSKRHRLLTMDDSLWRHLCETHFGPSPFEPPLPQHVDWRWIYRAQGRTARLVGPDVGAIWFNGRVFWGDVVNGKPHGFGVYIHGLCLTRDGILRKRADTARSAALTAMGRIQCEWVHGDAHGAAIETRPDSTRIERQWVHGKRQEHAVVAYPSGARYEGAFSFSRPCGQGTLTLCNKVTIERKWHLLDTIDLFDSGNMRVDFREPREPRTGIYVWASGARYDGEFNECGQRHGYGSMVHASGDIYWGEWRDDKRNGHGSMIYVGGNRYEGEWRDGMTNGHGAVTYADGNRYEGNWRNDMRDGHGTFTWASGQVYTGHYHQGQRHGPGVLKLTSGAIYKGTYRDGRRRGHGTVTYVDGSRLSGTWDDTICADAAVILHRAGDNPCSLATPCDACVALANDHSE
ncbi:Morn repeat protein [Pandoravirus inopinatum]|uniref:Morn repeat protein n=1 Tax=Pandoravirus inopinatum TaxID=1605721 RepID=A0A0B5J9L6_9VIRU|nr:Morn repeat protein [Pandoravirus inopinatum]AJF97571.1 Morn repeat protein [Pandoravirus inopinatum]